MIFVPKLYFLWRVEGEIARAYRIRRAARARLTKFRRWRFFKCAILSSNEATYYFARKNLAKRSFATSMRAHARLRRFLSFVLARFAILSHLRNSNLYLKPSWAEPFRTARRNGNVAGKSVSTGATNCKINFGPRH